MASVHDVAAYILKTCGVMTAMKLQKLLYYSQAWSLVWDEKPLFAARIEAWANGPVIPEVYKLHAGKFKVGPTWPKGDAAKIKNGERDTVTAVINYYGDKSSQWLSDLTHAEDPWKNARRGLSASDPGNQEITHAAMVEYYEALKA